MIRAIAVFAVAALAAWTQQAAPKTPQPKSQKEMAAVMAIQTAADPDARIQAAEALLAGFADTQFKEFASQMLTLSYQQKEDFDNMLINGERTLEINPDNVAILVTLAQSVPQRTREHDLDKEEKLGKADKWAKKALLLIPSLVKFNPQITDEEWTSYRKGAMSQAHEAIGMVCYVRKDYAGAEKSFQQAVEVSPQADPTSLFRLGMAYSALNKIDEGIEALDKAIAAGGVQVGGKDLAAEQKAVLVKAKAAADAAKPAATPPVEIKRP